MLLGKHKNKRLSTPFSFVYGSTYPLLNYQAAIADEEKEHSLSVNLDLFQARKTWELSVSQGERTFLVHSLKN